jgi:hypothetical protein
MEIFGFSKDRSVVESSPLPFNLDMLNVLEALGSLQTLKNESQPPESDESDPSPDKERKPAVDGLLEHAKGFLFSEPSQVTQTSNYLDYLDSQIQLANQEIQRLQKHKQDLQLKQQRVLDLAAQTMTQNSLTLLLGELGRKFTLHLSQSVQCLADPHSLPPRYQRIKITVEPDKVELKKALLDGTQIPGCCIVVNTSASWK